MADVSSSGMTGRTRADGKQSGGKISPAPRGTLADLLQGFSRYGRDLLGRYAPLTGRGRQQRRDVPTPDILSDLAHALLSGRGEASGVAIASDLLALYEKADDAHKRTFFLMLAESFGPDEKALLASWERYRKQGASALPALAHAVEAPRQEVLRRLNLAPGGTGALVRMRADLLRFLKGADAALEAVDADLVHLLQSWFNRGFLTMRPIDWSSPASLLERVIRYEAVHDISSWAELRRRLDPEDRRCFAFFHPAMPEEPLIFVEVGLTDGIPDSIQAMLDDDRAVLAASAANTAVFYSISNCQPGLRGISFGHFLIKQVVTDLKRELEGLDCFVTLSPVPGLLAWLRGVVTDPADVEMIEQLQKPESFVDEPEGARDFLLRHAVTYFTQARTAKGKPVDPVARFHLGNGARLERLNWGADTSANGLRQSGALMVNYLYDLGKIEALHEAYANGSDVATGEPFRKMVKALDAKYRNRK